MGYVSRKTYNVDRRIRNFFFTNYYTLLLKCYPIFVFFHYTKNLNFIRQNFFFVNSIKIVFFKKSLFKFISKKLDLFHFTSINNDNFFLGSTGALLFSNYDALITFLLFHKMKALKVLLLAVLFVLNKRIVSLSYVFEFTKVNKDNVYLNCLTILMQNLLMIISFLFFVIF